MGSSVAARAPFSGTRRRQRAKHARVSIAAIVGRAIVGGFSGTGAPESFVGALRRGERGGAILFRRNIEAPEQVAALNASLAAANPELLLGVDQEGGRVVRLGPPCLGLPPAMELGQRGEETVREVAEAQAEELRHLGFTTSFAPVLDVHSRPENPIIGDRAFSTDPQRAARLACAFADGLEAGGMLPCGKHFPGHGDTTQDSHLVLPTVAKTKAELLATELVPFRAAIERNIASLMTAHVVFSGLDPSGPATMSRAILHDLLRVELGYQGVVVSDDLEMKAITQSAGEAAVAAMTAGCDMLLVCSDEARQDEAFEALRKEAEASEAFRARCTDAAARAKRMTDRRRSTPNIAAFRAAVHAHARLGELLRTKVAVP